MDAPPATPSDGALRDHLSLALVPGLGPKLTRAVLAHFGSPRAVLSATAAQLEAVPGFGPQRAQKLANLMGRVAVDEELALLRRHRVRVCLAGSEEYPDRLAAIEDAPPLLYVRGALTPADRFAVGIVGSRGCTSYGRRTTELIAAGLAEAGYTVVSGLARGIDGAAHHGALSARGRTIAVLAGGLADIYPPEHAHLADEVAGAGALITETPMAMAPQPGMFHARNLRMMPKQGRNTAFHPPCHGTVTVSPPCPAPPASGSAPATASG